MKIRLVSIVFLLLCSRESIGSCLYDQYDKELAPIFVNSFINERIFSAAGLPINIADNSFLTAHCESNFSSPIFSQFGDDSIGHKEIKIRCEKNVLYYQSFPESVKNSEVIKQPPLTCSQSQIGIYEGQIGIDERRMGNNEERVNERLCHKSNIIYALSISRMPIIFGGICYDFDHLQPQFIHYGVNQNSFALDHPSAFTRSKLHYYPTMKLFTDFILPKNTRTAKLHAYFAKTVSKDQFDGTQFRFDELIPNRYLLQDFSIQPNMLGPNAIVWWSNLKDGNWKIVENAVEKFTSTEIYDIYTGTYSTEEDLHRNFGLKKFLHYSIDSVKNDIPLYIWKYVKPTLPSDSQNEVVIIGVNYPISKFDIGKVTFCTDICSRFKWLHNLWESGDKISSGYVFCCEAEMVRKIIPLITSIQLNYRNDFATKQGIPVDP